MESISNNINGRPILGSVKVHGVTYYVDINKKIFIKDEQEYSQIVDEQTLKEILDYITPKSLDVIEER